MARHLTDLLKEANDIIEKRASEKSPEPMFVEGESEVVKLAHMLMEDRPSGVVTVNPNPEPQSEMTLFEKAAHAIALVETMESLEALGKIAQFEKQAADAGYTEEQIQEFIEKKAMQPSHKYVKHLGAAGALGAVGGAVAGHKMGKKSGRKEAVDEINQAFEDYGKYVNQTFWKGFEKAASVTMSMGAKVPAAVRRGYDRMAHSSGSLDSLVTLPLAAASRAVFGKKKTYKATRSIHRAGLKADMALGHLPHKVLQHRIPSRFGLNRLFEQTDIVPVNRRKGIYQEVKRPSILAPVTKASEVVVPLATGLELSKALHRRKNQSQDNGQPTAS